MTQKMCNLTAKEFKTNPAMIRKDEGSRPTTTSPGTASGPNPFPFFDPRVREDKTRLPLNFVPSSYSVLIGRGKMCADAVGNRRLKVIVSRYLEEYSNASSRTEKSAIVSRIVDIVQDACPQGAFIKYEDGQWWEVSDNAARERVGSLLRDELHDTYKSSSKAKQAKRKKKREAISKDPIQADQSKLDTDKHDIRGIRGAEKLPMNQSRSLVAAKLPKHEEVVEKTRDTMRLNAEDILRRRMAYIRQHLSIDAIMPMDELSSEMRKDASTDGISPGRRLHRNSSVDSNGYWK